MAVQKAQSPLMKRLGNKLDQAVKAHAEDPIDYGFQRLPGGIPRGVAKLVVSKFDVVAPGKQNAGEYFYRAAGVVVEPQSVLVNGVDFPVAGLQTSIIEMVCDTKKRDGTTVTMEEHVANVLNEMKKLGGLDFVQGATGEDLERLAEELQEAGPYFYFSTNTSPEQLNPDGTVKFEARTWERWLGAADDYVPPEPNGVNDQGAAKAPAKAAPAPAKAPPGRKAPVAAAAPEPEPEGDLAALAAAADGADPDGAGREAMVEAVLALGWTQEQVDAWTESWTALADHLAAGGGPPEDAEAEAEEFVPQVGEMYKYQPVDPKTKKPMINPKTKKPVLVEVDVKKVNVEKRTVDLLNLDDKKTKYPNVSFDALVGEEG